MSGWDPDPGEVQAAPQRADGAPRRPDVASRASGMRLGPIGVTPIRVVIAIAFLGSVAFIGYAILLVRDARQIPMLSSGFLVLGLACAAMALGALIQLWRAGERGRTGRAMALAIVGGVAGLAAIGCLTVTVVFALLWKSA
jgi:hypothetical protein